MPRRLERILTPLDEALGDTVEELANEFLNGYHDWPGDRTDTREIEQARKFVDALEQRRQLLETGIAELRAELVRIEQTKEA